MIYSNIDKFIRKYSKELTEIGYKLDSNENYSKFSDAFTRISNSIIPKGGEKYPNKNFSETVFSSLFTVSYQPAVNINDTLKNDSADPHLEIKMGLKSNIDNNVLQERFNKVQESKNKELDKKLLRLIDISLLKDSSKSVLRDSIMKNKEIKVLYDKGELTEEQEDIYTQIIHNYSTQKHD